MTVAIVTDSNAQFPAELARRYGVEIVPLTVTVDGTAYAEGTELSADDFYAAYDDGHSPAVSTAAPSPGAFMTAYAAAAEAGATEILSIHIGAAVSATLNAARLAADAAPVPVRLVDTGTASFGVSACVWEAAEVLAGGGTADDAVAVAESLAPSVGNVFVVGALDIVRAGGRLAAGTADTDGVSVLSLVDGEITRVGAAADIESATEAMASYVLGHGSVDRPLRVSVGIADREAEPLSAALEGRLRDEGPVGDLVHYRIGPSVAAHTGPGTAGCFFWPRPG